MKKKIKVYNPPNSTLKICKDPVATITDAQLKELDPTGERRALFDYRRNPRSVKVGDILRVTFKSGDPFAGVCLSIRSRGIDTSFLLRNQLTRVGVEMWIKVFSPNVEKVEIVQRTEKRKRRARLYYMRLVFNFFAALSPALGTSIRETSIILIFPWPMLTNVFCRKPKHDMGSVENIVRNYLRQRRALTGQEVGKSGRS